MIGTFEGSAFGKEGGTEGPQLLLFLLDTEFLTEPGAH